MNKLTDCLINKNNSCKPVWFMRQAGRYLPEFRAIRSKNKDFVKLCLNSNLSSEITLQPIKRFNKDGTPKPAEEISQELWRYVTNEDDNSYKKAARLYEMEENGGFRSTDRDE